jgi:hypothetical protein
MEQVTETAMPVVRLGNIAECEVTGLRGTITQILTPAVGAKQLAIQARGNGETVPEALYVDEYLIKFIDNGVADRVPAPAALKFDFGQEVREMASDQVGVIVACAIHLNGCVYFGITTKSRANKSPETFYVNQERLTLVSEGFKEQLPKSEGTQRQPGGPSTRVSAMNVRV